GRDELRLIGREVHRELGRRAFRLLGPPALDLDGVIALERRPLEAADPTRAGPLELDVLRALAFDVDLANGWLTGPRRPVGRHFDLRGAAGGHDGAFHLELRPVLDM